MKDFSGWKLDLAHYLVRASVKPRLAALLEDSLGKGEVAAMRPFGRALHVALRSARVASGGRVLWEEEDDCSPPLREERAAVLDHYFEDLSVEPVAPGEGWMRISGLPFLFPSLSGAEARERHASESFSWVKRNRVTFQDPEDKG